jgi:hypothetical protein
MFRQQRAINALVSQPRWSGLVFFLYHFQERFAPQACFAHIRGYVFFFADSARVIRGEGLGTEGAESGGGKI